MAKKKKRPCWQCNDTGYYSDTSTCHNTTTRTCDCGATDRAEKPEVPLASCLFNEARAKYAREAADLVFAAVPNLLPYADSVRTVQDFLDLAREVAEKLEANDVADMVETSPERIALDALIAVRDWRRLTRDQVDAMFLAETGYLAPGRDCRTHGPVERREKWDEWTKRKNADLDASIERAIRKLVYQGGI